MSGLISQRKCLPMLEADMKNLQSALREPEQITVLCVSGQLQDQHALRNIFHHHGWHICSADTLQQASEKLQQGVVAVVVCDENLVDGSWRDLHQQLQQMEQAPLLVVCSQRADGQLWAEVLSLGAYDVLAKPFDKLEVIRVLGMAWRRWKGSRTCQSYQQSVRMLAQQSA